MKKFLIALSITLLAFGPIIAKKGAWIHNKCKGPVKVKIDKGTDKGWVELKAGAKKFFKTSSHGKRGIYWRFTTGGDMIQECKTKKYEWPTDFTLTAGGSVAIKTKHGLLKKTYTEKSTRECDMFYPRTTKLPDYAKIYERLKPLLENKNLKQIDEKRKAIADLCIKARRDRALYNKMKKAVEDEGSSIHMIHDQLLSGMPIKFEK